MSSLLSSLLFPNGQPHPNGYPFIPPSPNGYPIPSPQPVPNGYPAPNGNAFQPTLPPGGELPPFPGGPQPNSPFVPQPNSPFIPHPNVAHPPNGLVPGPQPNVILGNHHEVAPATDRLHAEGVISHLVSALGAARDPELKTSLSVALAALQKHVAGIHKEHQQMLAGKVSPRLMHEAYSNGNAHGGGAIPNGSVL